MAVGAVRFWLVLAAAALAGCTLPEADPAAPSVTIDSMPEAFVLPGVVPMGARVEGGHGNVSFVVEVDGRGGHWIPWAEGNASALRDAFSSAGIYRIQALLEADGSIVARSEPHVLAVSYRAVATLPCEPIPEVDLTVAYPCNTLWAPTAPGSFWVEGKVEYAPGASLAPCPSLRVYDAQGDETFRTYTWGDVGVSEVEALTWHDAAGDVGLQFAPSAPLEEVLYELVVEPVTGSRSGSGGRGC